MFFGCARAVPEIPSGYPKHTDFDRPLTLAIRHYLSLPKNGGDDDDDDDGDDGDDVTMTMTMKTTTTMTTAKATIMTMTTITTTLYNNNIV